MYSGWGKTTKNFRTWKSMQSKEWLSFLEKNNCHDKIPWQFPDIDQMAKIPWHFFKIPWQFPDLEKILFFPDFSLTRGNPATHLPPRVKTQRRQSIAEFGSGVRIIVCLALDFDFTTFIKKWKGTAEPAQTIQIHLKQSTFKWYSKRFGTRKIYSIQDETVIDHYPWFFYLHTNIQFNTYDKNTCIVNRLYKKRIVKLMWP